MWERLTCYSPVRINSFLIFNWNTSPWQEWSKKYQSLSGPLFKGLSSSRVGVEKCFLSQKQVKLYVIAEALHGWVWSIKRICKIIGFVSKCSLHTTSNKGTMINKNMMSRSCVKNTFINRRHSQLLESHIFQTICVLQ